MSKVKASTYDSSFKMARRPHVTVVGLVVLQCVILKVQASDSGPFVSLDQGRYRGNYVTSASRNHVSEYLGIPFAKPPVGGLRFADPIPVDPMPEKMFDAKHYGPSCPQDSDYVFGNFSAVTRWNPPGDVVSEDCLYLNIWVPHGASHKDKTVMVWIYGGGFYSGTSSLQLYNGKTIAGYGDVIVVSINYRLGILGFLSSGDTRIAGNFGLMDQVQALTWVRDNIRAFGGDPGKVTIFGESAGAVSVRFHLLSPLSSGLFQRGILQSDASDSLVFADHQLSSTYSKKLFKKLNCADGDDVLGCLRSLPYNVFLKNQWFTYDNDVRSPFQPTLTSFMPQRPNDMLDTMEGKDVLAGTNSNEGTYFMLYKIEGMTLADQVAGQTREKVREIFEQFSIDFTPEEREAALDFYTQGVAESDLVGNRDLIDAAYTDQYFVCPTKTLAAANTAAGGNSYVYYYSHRASNERWPEWTGVMHGAEIEFVFGLPLNSSNGYTQLEKTFSERLIKYWTNFAKTGNPNNQGNTPWPKFTPEKEEFIELSLQERKREGGLRPTQCSFWDNLTNSGSRQHGSLYALVMATVLMFTWLA